MATASPRLRHSLFLKSCPQSSLWCRVPCKLSTRPPVESGRYRHFGVFELKSTQFTASILYCHCFSRNYSLQQLAVLGEVEASTVTDLVWWRSHVPSWPSSIGTSTASKFMTIAKQTVADHTVHSRPIGVQIPLCWSWRLAVRRLYSSLVQNVRTNYRHSTYR